jgi:DNA-binding PadR family transcriptional regulator
MTNKPDHFGVDFMPMEAKRIILKIRILGRLVQGGRVYSYALIKEFDKMGFADFYGPTLKNDLYNTLRVLEKSGYIKMQAKMEGRKIKNYYSITKDGTIALKSVGKMMIGTVKQAGRLFK